jgi:hypothetical protein
MATPNGRGYNNITPFGTWGSNEYYDPSDSAAAWRLLGPIRDTSTYADLRAVMGSLNAAFKNADSERHNNAYHRFTLSAVYNDGSIENRYNYRNVLINLKQDRSTTLAISLFKSLMSAEGTQWGVDIKTLTSVVINDLISREAYHADTIKFLLGKFGLKTITPSFPPKAPLYMPKGKGKGKGRKRARK